MPQHGKYLTVSGTQYILFINISSNTKLALSSVGPKRLYAVVKVWGDSSPPLPFSIPLPASRTHGHLHTSRAFKWLTWHFPEQGPWARTSAPLSPLLKITVTMKPHATVLCTQEGSHRFRTVLFLDSHPDLPTDAVSGFPGSWIEKLRSQIPQKIKYRIWLGCFGCYYYIALFLKEIKVWTV